MLLSIYFIPHQIYLFLVKSGTSKSPGANMTPGREEIFSTDRRFAEVIILLLQDRIPVKHGKVVCHQLLEYGEEFTK